MRKEFDMAIQKKSLNRGSKNSKRVKTSAGNAVKSERTMRGAKAVNLKESILKLPAVQ